MRAALESVRTAVSSSLSALRRPRRQADIGLLIKCAVQLRDVVQALETLQPTPANQERGAALIEQLRERQKAVLDAIELVGQRLSKVGARLRGVLPLDRTYRLKFEARSLVAYTTFPASVFYACEAVYLGGNVDGVDPEPLRPPAASLRAGFQCIVQLSVHMSTLSLDTSISTARMRLCRTILAFDRDWAAFEWAYLSQIAPRHPSTVTDELVRLTCLLSHLLLEVQEKKWATPDEVAACDPRILVGVLRLAVLQAFIDSDVEDVFAYAQAEATDGDAWGSLRRAMRDVRPGQRDTLRKALCSPLGSAELDDVVPSASDNVDLADVAAAVAGADDVMAAAAAMPDALHVAFKHCCSVADGIVGRGRFAVDVSEALKTAFKLASSGNS